MDGLSPAPVAASCEYEDGSISAPESSYREWNHKDGLIFALVAAYRE